MGNIELHINTSDWNKHGHDTDSNYKNVILHVVWQHDDTHQSATVPLFELQNRVPVLLLNQYDEWMQQSAFVPCAGVVQNVKEIVWIAWQERLLAERLQQKSSYLLQLLQINNYHWEETCWQLLAKNFGMQVNADAFVGIAQSLPIAVLAKT